MMIRHLRPLFAASFFFSFHLALLSYLNSSVLAQHASTVQLTLSYTVASMLALVLVLIAPHIVGTVGASRFLIGLLMLSLALLVTLGLHAHHPSFVWIFVLYFSLNTVIWYAFDLVIEHYSREHNTGNIRGLYLTLQNTGWVIAPITSAAVIGIVGFGGTYLVASVGIVLALFILVMTPRIKEHQHVPRISFKEAFRQLTLHPYARRLVTLYFVLQFFFAWMVLYMAPYLRGLGFAWKTIGVILSIMLLPFVLFQYATGKIADKRHNERTLLIIGFGIAAFATLLLALPLPPTAAIFAGLLFLTRVGASIIEVATESAFFKAVNEHDTALISTLRMTLPFAYIIAPLIGAGLLAIGGMHVLFGVLGAILLLAALYATRLGASNRPPV